MVQQIFSIIKYELIFVKQTRSVFTITLSPDSSSHIITFLQVIAQNLTPEVINLNSTLVSPLVSLSVVSDSLQSHGLQPARLLCSWNSPGKNIGVGCHFLLQRILPGIKPGSLALQADSLPWSHQGSPIYLIPKRPVQGPRFRRWWRNNDSFSPQKLNSLSFLLHHWLLH